MIIWLASYPKSGNNIIRNGYFFQKMEFNFDFSKIIKKDFKMFLKI